MSAIDDLTPVPAQPEISEGNKTFSQKTYALYVYIRTKLIPAMIELQSLIINAITGSYSGSSTTSLTITDTGELSLTTDTGRGFKPGTPVRLASAASPLNYVDGVTKSYNATTGAFVMFAQVKNGSGTFASWSLTIIPSGGGLAGLGANKFTGLQSFANEVPVDSAANLDLTAANSNLIKLTGTTPVESITMPQSTPIKIKAASAVVFVHSASLAVQGLANYTCMPGDLLELTKDGDGVVRVTVIQSALITLATATQAEAEAQALNNRIITPLRLKQVIDYIFNKTGDAPAFACRAFANINMALAGTYAGGAATVTRAASFSTAAITTTNDHGHITGNYVYALTGVVAGYYQVTVTGPKTFTITTVATTALTAVPITFGVLTIRNAGNIGSVASKNPGVSGDCIVNYKVAMPNDNYSLTANCTQRGGASAPGSNRSVGFGADNLSGVRGIYTAQATQLYCQISSGADVAGDVLTLSVFA